MYSYTLASDILPMHAYLSYTTARCPSVGVSARITPNRKHVDVLSHADLECHADHSVVAHYCNPNGNIYLSIYLLGNCHDATRNSIKTLYCTRGSSHLNSDKPFRTRRYYAVQEDPGSVSGPHPPTLIIYPCSSRRPVDEPPPSSVGPRCQCFQSLGVLTGCLRAKSEYTVIPSYTPTPSTPSLVVRESYRR